MKTFILTIALTAACGFCFAQTTPMVAGQERPPTVMELKVADPGDSFGDRKSMVSLIRLADSALVFKQAADANGLPNFYAADKYNTSVEIVGKEDSLVTIQWTFRMIVNNGAATNEELGRMRYFAMLMGGQPAYDWFTNIYLNFKDKPLEDYTETKLFYTKRHIEFKYLPRQRKITLTITTVKPGM